MIVGLTFLTFISSWTAKLNMLVLVFLCSRPQDAEAYQGPFRTATHRCKNLVSTS